MENRLLNYWKNGRWFNGPDPSIKAPEPTAPTVTAPVTAPKTTDDLANQNKLAKTPEQIAENKARSEAEFNRPQPDNTTYSPYQALQDRPTGSAPVSPYVPNKTVQGETPQISQTQDATGVTPVTPTPEPSSTITDYSAQAEDELMPGYNQWKSEMEGLFDQFEEQKDEKISSYEQIYNNQIQTLNELEKMMRELSAQKNALVAGSAEVQNAEIQAAYDANAEQLRLAKLRLDETQRKVMSEREKQLDRKKMNEENMLAVIGGFGSMAGNKMLLDSVEDGEEAIAGLKTEFSIQDQEHTAKTVELVNTYKNDKLKVEQWKQEQIMKNYENLQSYIANILKDKEMSYEDKIKSINNAKDQYNNTISQISMDVIDARFELSRDIIQRADELREITNAEVDRSLSMQRDEIDTARADLALFAENYTMTDYNSLSDEVKSKFEELEKKADLPPGFTEVAIENFKEQNKDASKIMSQTDENGNWTIVGVDSNGNVVAQTTINGAGKNTIKEPTNEMEKAFGVGTIGGWCGDFGSRVSTASTVGDSWESKLAKVTTRENPKAGFKVAIPLGVTDAGKDNGHIAVVLNYNPETKDFLVIQSNADGRQTRGEGQGVITMETFNIDNLNSQYGDNWGFIPGELKGDYAKYAEKYGLTEPVDPYADDFGTTPQEPVQTETVNEEVATPNGEYDYDAEFADYE
uniref:Uncharacterized protein n=1 Tax=viral metagenome TaxID=1070528 RepID=A0A6M3J8M1_9ZZZZ